MIETTEEKDAVCWAIFTMIRTYPGWAEDSNVFAKIAVKRLEGVRHYLRRNNFPSMESDLNRAIAEIRKIA